LSDTPIVHGEKLNYVKTRIDRSLIDKLMLFVDQSKRKSC